MVKKGDTLIEVTLAIGIFSMIAIGVAAVMSSGTSGAQTALETTLAREEIDTQAEALRFIQSAYATDKDSADKRFTNLWEVITKNAITDAGEEILQYAPSSCGEVFNNNSSIKNHAFVINPRKLGSFTASKDQSNSDGIYSVYIPQSSGKLTTASIYPRLVFTGKPNPGPQDVPDAESQDALLDNNSRDILYRAEGLYVIAVKDAKTTGIVSDSDRSVKGTSAYYDFYIRTCWYGVDADEPSTISTVIRLYDPDAIK